MGKFMNINKIMRQTLLTFLFFIILFFNSHLFLKFSLPFLLYNTPVEDRPDLAQVLPPVVVQYLIPIAWRGIWAPMRPFLLE